MICIQKTYGFHGLNHQIIEKNFDVTPVTDGGKWKIGQYSGRTETTKNSRSAVFIVFEFKCGIVSEIDFTTNHAQYLSLIVILEYLVRIN